MKCHEEFNKCTEMSFISCDCVLLASYGVIAFLPVPNLEHCTQVWRPYLIKDIKLLEGIQHFSV